MRSDVGGFDGVRGQLGGGLVDVDADPEDDAALARLRQDADELPARDDDVVRMPERRVDAGLGRSAAATASPATSESSGQSGIGARRPQQHRDEDRAARRRPPTCGRAGRGPRSGDRSTTSRPRDRRRRAGAASTRTTRRSDTAPEPPAQQRQHRLGAQIRHPD